MSIQDEIARHYRLEIEESPAGPSGWHWRILALGDGSVERGGALAYPSEAEARAAGEEALEKHARYKLLGTLDDWT